MVLAALLLVATAETGAAPSAQAVYTGHMDEYALSYCLLANMRSNTTSGVYLPDLDIDFGLVNQLVGSVYPQENLISKQTIESNETGNEMTRYKVSIVTRENVTWYRDAKSYATWVVDKLVKPGMTGREKARVLHDWLVNHCRFSGNAAPEELLPYTAYGAFYSRDVVCNAYAHAYTMLMQAAGIPVLRITGTIRDTNGEWSHAWNMVFVENQWLYVDVTWDDRNDKNPSYDYFLVTGEQLRKDHVWSEQIYKNFLPYVLPERPDYAAALAQKGLLLGTPSGGYDLQTQTDRIQVAAIIARLLGNDETVPTHVSYPFDDIPRWAAGHVNFLYSRGLLQGTSANRFSPNRKISYNDFFTLLLRVMGYEEEVDFTWESAPGLALRLNLADANQIKAWGLRPFLRADIVNITYVALNAQCRDGATLQAHVSQYA